MVDAISEVPADRWSIADYYDANPDMPGKMNTRFGGFVSGIDGFDPHFFGISPREARTMDPQQRILLEIAYEESGPETGYPVLLLHGFPYDPRAFDAVPR